MPRTKQMSECLFCGNLPCTCNGPVKEKKKRAPRKTAPVPRERVDPEVSPVPSDGAVVPDTEPVPRDEGPVVFPSETGRKRSRFAQATKSPGGPRMGTARPVRAELPMDEESVAIRNLADAGMLAESELARHQDRIVPQVPVDLDRRRVEWKNNG